MPNQPVFDPQFWRNLAGKARATADQTLDDRTKRLLLRIAETHERVAERVERRLRDAEKSNSGERHSGGRSAEQARELPWKLRKNDSVS
jgi:hypothetical protein